MKNNEITFHPAECDPRGCSDMECPYSHYDSWKFGKFYYDTREQAEEAALKTAQDKA